MSLEWSFSMERGFRRCQKQFFFRNMAAAHRRPDRRHQGEVLHESQRAVDFFQLGIFARARKIIVNGMT